MRIIYYGGKQAGMIGLLTVLAAKHEVICVIPTEPFNFDSPMHAIPKLLTIPVVMKPSLNFPEVAPLIASLKPDLFLCVHGRQIIGKDILSICKCVNVHPCLYRYPGADPIGRMLADGVTRASVAAHYMTEQVDQGEVITELFTEVNGKTREEVYNELYPLYAQVIIDALRFIETDLAMRFTVGD